MYDSSTTVTSSLDGLHLSGSESAHAEEKEVSKVVRRFPEEEDEDILRETNDRFVLFPIKYHQVSYSSIQIPSVRDRQLIPDMARLQSLPSEFLDSRRDRPDTRPIRLER